ncbi:MAG TPA: sigma-54-dependent Fis family transcriptional regulator [Deltaproteobacteria bacterium]|nr:sigma-54-dependent Fis family transcriptional regulator [Deltaproteobacteria bacterium]
MLEAPPVALRYPCAMDGIEGARPAGETHRYGILVVDDEDAILESLEFTLGMEYRIFTATSGEKGLEILDREDIALVISDQVMPGMSGVEFLERVIERNPRAIRIMLTGYADMPSLVRAINEGRIYRYLPKPWEPDDLRIAVKRALEVYELSSENAQLADALAEANERLRAENLYLRREVEARYSFEGIIGDAPAMQKIFDVTEKVAQTDATVLLTGETGTGKDLLARAIHYTGRRKDRKFVAQNCGALPDTLLESELFGHKRGAFTGAHADKKGLFEVADGGTIFLDEIGETEPGMQVRLLRVLQDGEIRPLGSSETRKVDVRVVAATNRDLKKRVEEGRFREDLYYRLRVVEIELPPLRERREDIPALAHHFLDQAGTRMNRKFVGFSNAAMDRLVAHDWPGNVRELANEIERAAALAGPEETLGLENLSEHLRGAGGPPAVGRGIGSFPGAPGRPAPTGASGFTASEEIGDWNLNRAVDALKRRMLIAAVREAGSKSRAAEKLGIPRQSLQKMIKRLEIPAEELVPPERASGAATARRERAENGTGNATSGNGEKSGRK